MKGQFADFASLACWLESRGMFHMQLGLGRMAKALLELELDNPPFRVCQVLGTNGKGSVCAFLNALCQASGLKSGLYTSPHFLSPRERIRVDGQLSLAENWVECANCLAEKCAGWRDLTYFEFITLLAMLVFRKAGVEIAIMEAGLGGQNDATSALGAQWQCFAQIALDHRAIIGPGLMEIATDKARAMKWGSRIFSTPQFPLAAEILEEEARRKHCRLEFCEPYNPHLPARLSGQHQALNMGLALGCARAIWREMDVRPLDSASIETALSSAFLPGRRQKIAACLLHPELLLDGGHNPHAILNLAAALPENPKMILFACMADKDWQPSLLTLAKRWPQARFLMPDLEMDRAAKNTILAECVNRRWPGRAAAIEGEDSVEKALERARAAYGNDLCLVTGSFFLLAQVYQLFPEYLQDNQQRDELVKA